MLGNEVSSTGVQAPSEEAGEDEVDQRPPSEEVDQEGIGSDHGGDVDCVPDGRSLRADEAGSDRVEQQLEGAAASEFVQLDDTHAKKVFPATLFNNIASARLGMSVSIPSVPRNL